MLCGKERYVRLHTLVGQGTGLVGARGPFYFVYRYTPDGKSSPLEVSQQLTVDFT
ncbi:hypothetical protein SGGMMB4_00066 [Sodalis glossinidius str. 'morsitans']|uniref:Uncharacterized protein n=2 Tax=Sodalis glossinidius TaxID=63612 RepID=A0A193QFB2_SODGM|nr:hypothetical protein SGGMMB4_00066 [Sodalis glossinidius str. 'morsitans']